MNSIELQLQFFAVLKSMLPPHVSLADELASKLNLSYDSVYRRLRGEKPLSLGELQFLSSTYKISLDNVLLLQSDAIVFFAPDINQKDGTFLDYMSSMLMQLKIFKAKPSVSMRYFCKDMTFFLFFLYPEMAAFKSFFYLKTMRREAVFKFKKFSMNFEEFNPYFEIGQQIIREYNDIPSIEIWNVESINSTLNQIAFYRDTGVFDNRETLKKVIDSFEATVDHIMLQLESGQKFMPGESEKNRRATLQFYHNEIVLGNNTILIESENNRESWITYNAFSYMVTRDPRFCTKSFNTFDNLLSQSTLLSCTGEKERNKLFMQLKEKIRGLREGG